MSRDWRCVLVYPWWLVAVLCFLLGAVPVWLIIRYWIVPAYLLTLIQQGP